MKKLFVVLLAACMFSACDSPKPTEPASKPAEPKKEKKEALLITGRSAFQKVFIAARNWTADARPYNLVSDLSTTSLGRDGKASIWRAGFASLSRRGLKAFTWNGASGEDDIGNNVEDTFNPNNALTQPFDVAFLKVDSDQAFEVAQKNGGDKILKADAKLPVFYRLTFDSRKNELIWHVIYGTSEAEAKLRIAVNASTGVFMQKEK